MNNNSPLNSISVLKKMIHAHRLSAKFYRNSKDRTYDTVLTTLEIMHENSARVIEDSLGIKRKTGKSKCKQT